MGSRLSPERGLACVLLILVLVIWACKPGASVEPEVREVVDEPDASDTADTGETPDTTEPTELTEPEPEPDEDVDAAAKQTLAQTIRSYLDDLQSCYEAELRSDKTLAGKMTYTVTIQPGGTVSAVLIDLDEVGSEAVRACAVAEIEAWTFGSTDLNEATDVTFSVNFTPV